MSRQARTWVVEQRLRDRQEWSQQFGPGFAKKATALGKALWLAAARGPVGVEVRLRNQDTGETETVGMRAL